MINIDCELKLIQIINPLSLDNSSMEKSSNIPKSMSFLGLLFDIFRFSLKCDVNQLNATSDIFETTSTLMARI